MVFNPHAQGVEQDGEQNGSLEDITFHQSDHKFLKLVEKR
jgi:hypothetical protein